MDADKRKAEARRAEDAKAAKAAEEAREKAAAEQDKKMREAAVKRRKEEEERARRDADRQAKVSGQGDGWAEAEEREMWVRMKIGRRSGPRGA